MNDRLKGLDPLFDALLDHMVKDMAIEEVMRVSLALTRKGRIGGADALGILMGACMELGSMIGPTTIVPLTQALAETLDLKLRKAPREECEASHARQAAAIEAFRKEGDQEAKKVIREMGEELLKKASR